MKPSAARPQGRLLARNTLLNLVGLGVPMLVALLAVPLLVGGLGTSRFGILAIAWMLLSYLGELGFGSTTTKFTAEAIGRRRGDLGPIAWTTAAMQGALGLLTSVALFAATPWLVERTFNIAPELWPEARLCLYLLAGTLPVLGLAKSFRGVLEAGQRFDLITAVRLPATAANYLLPLGGVALGWSLPAIFGLILVSRVFVLVTYATLAIRTFPDAGWRPRIEGDRWREMLGFGGWTTVSSTVSPLLVYLDRFFVGILLSMTAVTYYAAPYEVVARLLIIPSALVGTLYPAFSQLDGSGDRRAAAALAARSVKAVLLVMAPLVLLLIGGAAEGLELWLGAEFARESAAALQILGVGVLINAMAHIPYSLLTGAGRPDLPARFHLLELPAHALVAWLLVSRWGITGAAAAWSLRVTVDAVLLFGASWRLSLLRLDDLGREGVFRAAGIAAVGAAACAAVAGMDGATGMALLAALVTTAGLVLWRFGMAPAERTRLVGLFRSGAAR